MLKTPFETEVSNFKMADASKLAFVESFDEPDLNSNRWLPFYLPQWSSRAMSKPHYQIRDQQLVLQITADQQPWCPEFNGAVKCSSLQTGVYAGKLGSGVGQHKIDAACVVREEQQNRFTYLPQFGYFEIRMKAVDAPANVAALWMIGYEDEPHRNAEICIVEIKGHHVKKNKAIIGYGIRKFSDPLLQDEFYEESFDINVMDFNCYAALWSAKHVSFYINHQLIRTIQQSPQYPMQLMLGLYEVPVKRLSKRDKEYPKEFVVDYVKGYGV